jgi:hypothetical protein
MCKNTGWFKNRFNLDPMGENTFSYPDGSWFFLANLLTIHHAPKDNSKVGIFIRTEISTNPFITDWPRILTGSSIRNIQVVEQNLSGMVFPPLKKLSNEFCVSLADWGASLFKTISVELFGKPKDLAAQAAFLTSAGAGFINDHACNVDSCMVFHY